ncbi:pilus assembly protein Flp/PilA [Evansella vedderi]|uniref:Pilus assembly protein Flp/PilA n=1 Tax=Evansella vedderi TaxID=38282 RepID=A0ABU0A1J8_9BACI|nr:Flp family type IVb pilin [Evansella vedderi]MDQ0256989.1 pilus assembly protein Flp/PilA [Evansella vedderi]
MLNKFKELVIEEEGQGMTEYALVLGILAVGIVGILALFREEITAMYNEVLGELKGRHDVPTSNNTTE